MTALLLLAAGLAYADPPPIYYRPSPRFQARRDRVMSELLPLAGEGRAQEALERHDKDFLRCHPPLADTFAARLSPGRYEIRGELLYTALDYPGRYAYDVLVAADGKLKVVVEIRFASFEGGPVPGETWRELDAVLRAAAVIWTAHVPAPLAGRLSFEFRPVVLGGHYSLPVTRAYHNGPYFLKWSRAWDPGFAAHELGHMMGLNDEYDVLSRHVLMRRGTCLLKSSLMCDTEASPRAFHYYFILRRLFCRPSNARR